jgi:Mycobacterium membrane protein
MTRHNSGNTSRSSTHYTATRELVRDDADDSRRDHDYDYDDGEIVYYEDSSRWRWAAAITGAVVALAMILAILIVRGGDSVSTRPGIVPSKSAPALTPPRPTSRPSSPPTTSPPAETVTTVTPSATTSSSTAPAPLPTKPQVDPRAITYTVLGSRQPGDIVTVTYLDETGLPRTDFNVTLPWTKTILSGGKVLVNSVTAVSLASHLNCTITDANGQILTSQSHNTIAAACTR